MVAFRPARRALPRAGRALDGRALRGDCQMFHVEQHTALQARLGARYRAPAER